MLTEKDYCDYDTCVALKELGHDEKCHGYYEPQKRCFNTTSIKHSWCNSEVDDIGVIICPTLYEAQKWLREEKNICVEMTCCAGGYVWELCKAYNNRTWISGSTIYTKPNMDNPLLNDCGKYESYEDALLEGIKEAVKILKEK